MTPVRIQLRRTKGWRMPPNTVKVTRGPGSKWGNPFKVHDVRMLNGDWEVFRCTDGQFSGPPVGFYGTRREALAAAVEFHRRHMESDAGALLRRQAVADLRGRNLACWCAPDAPCHADVLLELANR